MAGPRRITRDRRRPASRQRRRTRPGGRRQASTSATTVRAEQRRAGGRSTPEDQPCPCRSRRRERCRRGPPVRGVAARPSPACPLPEGGAPRTVIAPLPREVEAQLAAIDARLARIARRYIRRLALEPRPGHRSRAATSPRVACAPSTSTRQHPDDLFGARRTERRSGGTDPSAGPRFRVVYRAAETRDGELRVIGMRGGFDITPNSSPSERSLPAAAPLPPPPLAS